MVVFTTIKYHFVYFQICQTYGILMIHRKGFSFYFLNTLKWFFSFTLNNKLKIKYENKQRYFTWKIKIKS